MAMSPKAAGKAHTRGRTSTAYRKKKAATLGLAVAESLGLRSGEISVQPLTVLPLSLFPTFIVPFFILVHLSALVQAVRSVADLNHQALARFVVTKRA